jgi:hypothetical protein
VLNRVFLEAKINSRWMRVQESMLLVETSEELGYFLQQIIVDCTRKADQACAMVL